MMTGSPAQVLPAYLDSVDRETLLSGSIRQSTDGDLRITRVSFTDDEGDERETFTIGENIVVEVQYCSEHPVQRPHFVLSVADAQGGPPLFLASMLVDGCAPPFVQGEGIIRCRFESVPLKERAYHVWGEVWAADRARFLVNWQRFGTFRIAGGAEEQEEQVGRGSIRHMRADAPVQVPYVWEC